MIPLGTKAPDFKLMDVRTQEFISLQNVRSPIATVVMFICNHCPFVKHLQSRLATLASVYQAKNISFIAINSNDVVAYPADHPDKMRSEAEQHHYSFPYLFDETQAIAKAYQAACTPDFYIFDKELLCVYRGRFDDSTPTNQVPVTGKDVQSALDNVLAGIPVDPQQYASVGCNIKWKDEA
jgi:peroxiredoxin